MLNESFVEQYIEFKQLRRLSFAFIICSILLAFAPSCEAQYFGWGSGLGYNGIGSSLLYPLSYLFSSGYGNSYASPLYGIAALGGGFANNALYNSYRNIPLNYAGNYAYSNNYSYSGNNYPQLGTMTNTNYPFNYNNGYNQYSASGWNYSPNQTPPPQKPNDPNDIFNSQTNPITPPVAPDRHVFSEAPNTKALDGFFRTVNTRYKGNLFHALNQSDMRAWAESIGLLQPGTQLPKNINPTRKNEISAITRDVSLDTQKKFDILRLLLGVH